MWQLVGAAALIVGLAGLYLQGQCRHGWAVGVASSVLWLPAFVAECQWAAVANTSITAVLMGRNYFIDTRRTNVDHPERA